MRRALPIARGVVKPSLSTTVFLTAGSESFLSPALDPDLTQAHELLAHTLRDMGLVEEAIRRYKPITEQRST